MELNTSVTHTSAVSGFRSIFNALSMLFNAVMVLNRAVFW